jgi:negative regulator of replication initiation
MKTIKISDEVWDVIANDGKFGETADDVLRRLLKVGAGGNGKPIEPRAWKERRATVRMTQNNCRNNELVLKFDTGTTFRSPLPPKGNKSEIRRVRDAAIEFVKTNGGTIGQEHAAIRALTSNGYHVT